MAPALYTGEAGPKRTMVSADGLITQCEEIRDEPSDILLAYVAASRARDELVISYSGAPSPLLP